MRATPQSWTKTQEGGDRDISALMSAYAYAVVLFEEEGCVGIAYKTWIESREDALFCYWPQDSISALKRAKRKEMPDKDMWTRHKVMVVSYTDDFD